MKRHAGFTLVELLIVIAIIGLMLAAMMPAVVRSRDAARRSQCAQKLSTLALAVHQYESAFVRFPAAAWNETSPIASEEKGKHQSWTVSLLPYLDRNDVYRATDLEQSVYAEANARVRALEIERLTCPGNATAIADLPVSSYAASYHDREAPIAEDSSGALVLNHPLRVEEFEDGLAYTLLLGEKHSEPDDLGWMSGTRATLRNTGHPIVVSLPAAGAAPSDKAFVGGFGSQHSTGGNFALADAQVRFIAHTVSPQVLQQLGNRLDGGLLGDDAF